MPSSRVPFLLTLALALPIAGTTRTHAEDLILYTTLQPYNLDIYLREAPGAAWRRVTSDQANDYNPVFSPDGRWLVFCSERRGNPDLFALDLEGGGPPRPLTSGVTMDDAAAFSPDGSYLVFVSDRHGDADLFRMPFAPDDPEGDRHAVNLTSSPGGDFNPAVSPDGRWIAYSSERHLPPSDPAYWQLPPGAGVGDIYVMPSHGGEPRRLTRTKGWDGAPAWSEDGRHLYFYSERDGHRRIWRMAADGSDPRPVSPVALDGAVSATPGPGGRMLFVVWGGLHSATPEGGDLREEHAGDPGLEAPAFHLPSGRLAAHGEGPVEGRTLRPDGRTFAASGTRRRLELPDRTVVLQGIYGLFPALAPDGRRVASFQTWPPGDPGRRALVVSGTDGSNPRTIYESEGQLFSSTWSPDGEWILFAEGVVFAPENVRVDVLRIRPDGSELERVTDSATNDAFPDVADDGRIVWRRGRDGDKEIYLRSAAGEETVRLTERAGVDTMPAISPDGSWVLFSSDLHSPPGVGLLDLLVLQLSPGGTPGAAAPAWLPGLEAVVMDPSPDVHPRFSPDGRWFVYVSGRGGLNDEPVFGGGPQAYGEIWAQPFPFAGPPGPPVRLTHNKWEDALADWATVAEPAAGAVGEPATDP